jgi:hypothetical protein
MQMRDCHLLGEYTVARPVRMQRRPVSRPGQQAFELRFMNDLATYRIDVSWLWSLLHHGAVITKDGYLKRPALTEMGLYRL